MCTVLRGHHSLLSLDSADLFSEELMLVRNNNVFNLTWYCHRPYTFHCHRQQYISCCQQGYLYNVRESLSITCIQKLALQFLGHRERVCIICGEISASPAYRSLFDGFNSIVKGCVLFTRRSQHQLRTEVEQFKGIAKGYVAICDEVSASPAYRYFW